MSGLGENVKKAFNDWDVNKSGSIPAEKLREVMKSLNPAFTDDELDKLLRVADKNKDGVIEYAAFVDFVCSDTLAAAAGGELPAGSDSDAKVTHLQESLVKLRDPRVGPKPWLETAKNFLDPVENPSGFRMCQDIAINEDGVSVFFDLTRKDRAMPTTTKKNDSDLIRSLAWECLARCVFGSGAGAEKVAAAPELVPALQRVLQDSPPPEKLSALQLVQAVAASSGEAAGAVMPEVLAEVVPLLTDTTFRALTEAAFDVLTSCSFASAVIQAAGWPQLAALTAENEGRPEWLPTEPLQIFLSGRLATNVLSGPPPGDEADAGIREQMATRLSEGRFLGFFVDCLGAAVARREWPVGTQAYHSVSRLGELLCNLATLGHSKRLEGAVPHLVQAVTIIIDYNTSRACLRALRALCKEVSCLEALFAMTEFRTETLDMLHKTGDEPEATDLLSYLATVEPLIDSAAAVLEESRKFNELAPSIRELEELFTQFCALDEEMNTEQVVAAAVRLPLSPASAVKATIGSSKFTFQTFAERVYGTATHLGWWPSLMEDAAAELKKKADVPNVPTLARAAELFEKGSGGTSSVGYEGITEHVLPSAGLPTDVLPVEAELSALGSKQLEFKGFVSFLCRVCVRLRDAAKDEEEA